MQREDWKCVLIYGASQTGRTTIATALLQTIRPDVIITAGLPNLSGVPDIFGSFGNTDIRHLPKLDYNTYKDLRNIASCAKLRKKSCYVIIREGSSDFAQIQGLLMTYRHLGVGVIYISHSFPSPQIRKCFTHAVVMNTVDDAYFKKLTRHYNVSVPSDISRIDPYAGCMFATPNGTAGSMAIAQEIRVQM